MLHTALHSVSQRLLQLIPRCVSEAFSTTLLSCARKSNSRDMVSPRTPVFHRLQISEQQERDGLEQQILEGEGLNIDASYVCSTLITLLLLCSVSTQHTFPIFLPCSLPSPHRPSLLLLSSTLSRCLRFLKCTSKSSTTFPGSAV
jgi:hypothetical protein